jgi:sarcosine oxidase, subunit beta
MSQECGKRKRFADVVIVGGGLMGCSTAYALAKRGIKNIEVLERKSVGSGATGKSSGVLRCHYSIPVLGYMAWQSLKTFQAGEEIFGTSLGYEKTGYVVAGGPQDYETLVSNIEALQNVGIKTYMLSPDDIKHRYPSIYTDDTMGFAYEPEGGYADPSLTVQAFANAARTKGVKIHQGCSVHHLHVSIDGSKITAVETEDEIICSETVIIAAGVWSSPLLAEIGVDAPIRPQLERILFVNPEIPSLSLPVITDLITKLYMRTERNGSILVGDFDDSHPEFVAADDYEREISNQYIERTVTKFLERFPSFSEARLMTGYTGAYEVTPDYNPIMSKSGVEGLYVCAGFSGHGFKLSPIVGEFMSDLVLEGKSNDEIVDFSIFRLSRFAEGKPLVSQRQYGGIEQII